MSDYIEDLSKKIKETRKELEESHAVRTLLGNDAAKPVFDLVSLQITELVGRAFQDKKPLTYEQYLSIYGQVLGLRGFMQELQGKADKNVVLNEQVRIMDEQLKAAQGE